jgi:NCS1 family nucleobase:cation symporter-1
VAWTGGLAIAAVVLGVFSWAIHANHGKVGHLLETDIKLSGINKSFTMLYAISTAAGSITAYASRMSDWTRFSRTKHTPTIPSIIGPLIFASLTSILGILTTSAVHARYKVVQWNPLALLVYLQETQYTPACRAGTFFAGLALFWSLIVVSKLPNQSIFC